VSNHPGGSDIPDPDFNFSASDIPDPDFSKLRALDVPPEAVVSRAIRDVLAKVDERFPKGIAKIVALLVTMIPLTL
jgi:hypothetical protein